MTRFGDVARVADWIVSHKPKTAVAAADAPDVKPAQPPIPVGVAATPAPAACLEPAPRPRRADRQRRPSLSGGRMPGVLTIGDARLTMLNGGNFRLDGGAMHGVVPEDAVVEAGVVRRAQPLRVRDALPADRGGGQARAGRDRQRRQVLAQAQGHLRHRPRPRDRGRAARGRPRARRHRLRRHDAPAFRPQRRGDAPFDDRQRAGAGVPAGAPRRAAARVGGRHPPARAQPASYLQENIEPLGERPVCSWSTARRRSCPACACSRRPATPPATSRC